MMISSEKANKRAARAVAFAGKHKWAKYPCLAAVTAVYSAEFLRLKAEEIGNKIKESANAPFRPLAGRIAAFMLSGAFAFMAVPVTAYAEETETAEASETQTAAEEDENKELPQVEESKKTEKAKTPEDIAELVQLEGLSDESFSYGITLNIPWLDREVTARFSESAGMTDKVLEAFGRYGIPTEDLNIAPVDVTLYATESRKKLRFAEGYSADITLPVPDYMQGHDEDLKIVRMEEDGSMTVIEGDISESNLGTTITFNTEHFSVFALVAYKNSTAENISSYSGNAAAGISGDVSVSAPSNVFEEDRHRFKRKPKRRIYRIRRIMKERDLLL